VYVSGIDLSATATGVVNAPLPDAPSPIPFRAQVFGATGIEAMPAKLALSTMDELVRQIVRATVAHDLVTQGSTIPVLAVIEKPIAGGTSSRGVFERGYMWYCTVRELERLGVEVLPVLPGQLKGYMLGKGVGSKGAMIDALARRLPAIETGGDDNLADAGAAAAFAAEYLRRPLCTMPVAHLKYVETVRTPPVKAARKRAGR
jgi:hypothetical protein